MKKLAKRELVNLVGQWAARYCVLAPTLERNGERLLDDFDRERFTLDYKKTPSLPKSLLFPQSEALFMFENGEYRELLAVEQILLFGIRPCDLMGLRQSARFMTRDRCDAYVEAKWAAATTVVMACPGPQNETCFCTTMASGPVAPKGFDLQVFEIGDDLLIEAGSAKGEEAIRPFALDEVEERQAREQVEAFGRQAAGAVGRVGDVPAAMGLLADRSVDEGLWERLGAKCIQCGGCAFICPTCTCFNVCDREVRPGQGVRQRSWDACLLGGFTREASGHNPRSSQALRLKRRHEHKLLDYSRKDIQEALCGCTGCGRCSDFCPVHIGTLEVAGAIAAAGQSRA